jgi:hypothetical protein
VFVSLDKAYHRANENVAKILGVPYQTMTKAQQQAYEPVV